MNFFFILKHYIVYFSKEKRKYKNTQKEQRLVTHNSKINLLLFHTKEIGQQFSTISFWLYKIDKIVI